MARTALIAALAAGLVAGRAGTRAPEVRPPLTLTASDGGNLTIANGPSPTVIDSLLRVEQRGPNGWRPVSAALHAVASCSAPSAPAPATVTLRPRERLTVVGWTGFSCASQCARSCGFNLYWGEGRYRFGATVRPRGDLIVSNVFTMPRRPPPPRSVRSDDSSVQKYLDFAKRAHPL